MKINKKDVLVIVPARSGSEGLKNKNILRLKKIPLLAWSVSLAIKSPIVGKVLCATDSAEYADIAKSYGAEVPYLRAAMNATRLSTDLEYIEEALNYYQENENFRPKLVVLLRPTSPYRNINVIEDAISELLAVKESDSLRAVVPAKQTPYKMWSFDKGDFLEPVIKEKVSEIENYNCPRQILPKKFYQSGLIDVIKVETILAKKSFSGNKIVPYFVDPTYDVDIDTELDFVRAENIDLENSTIFIPQA